MPSSKSGLAKVSQHFIVLQPGPTEMAVSEGILYQGDPKLTYSDPVNGSFRFYLPPEAKGEVQVTINPARRHAHPAAGREDQGYRTFIRSTIRSSRARRASI